MEEIKINRDIAHLAVLQRIELIDPGLKIVRKLLGRYLFSNFFSKYLINVSQISNKYSNLMKSEFENLERFFKTGQNILSIGSGIGGFEFMIYKRIKKTKINFIEKNYVSKKVKYGWDNFNKEAYNSLILLEKFLIDNGVDKKSYNIFDADKDNLPKERFDIIVSLYSLDYHYDFNIYLKYFKDVFSDNTILIFDTIRAEYFEKIFKEINIIKEDNETMHKSKRIACKFLIR